MTQRVYLNSKSKIIDTAQSILATEGAHALTIERVIKDAGLSKAGFFYNFKTKEELMLALTLDLMKQFEIGIGEIIKKDKNPENRILRSYIKYCRSLKKEIVPLARIFQELFRNDVEVNKLLTESSHEFKKMILAEATDKPKALLIQMAMSGFWYDFARGCNSVYNSKDLTAIFKEIDSLLG